MLYREEAITANPLNFDPPTQRVVRSVPHKKAMRLRISWFVLGMVFGTSSAALVNYFTTDSTVEHAQVAVESPVDTSTLLQESDARETAKKNNAISKAENLARTAAHMKNPSHFTLEVSKGDTLSDLLTRKGVNYQEAHNIITALRDKYDPRRLVIGQKVELQLNESKYGDTDYDVASLSIKMTPIETLELTQKAKDDFALKVVQAELNTELSSGGGTINSSLYKTGIDTGVPPAILGTLINAYSYDVDFQREIRRGDAFNVVFEKMKTEDDITAGYGKLLFATLTLGGEEKKIYHYSRINGEDGYYDENGQSVRKALLRTPINGARLSSGFGMRRHPVLGYGKMHKGVDFAAARGTPIYAAGDGVIDYASRRGSYGNYIRIRHNNQYSSAYAHLKGFAKKTRKGARVKQGQVIGYVGTTGRSTGPHLHYEVLKAGTQINPKSVKFPNGHKLAGTELANFKENIKQIDLLARRMIKGESSLAQADITQ
ncbi:MAG: peptidoglycan DD-metalloendopeptidase family protein [Alphaproteobacteria bacterium]|nr:peptidoglycan DD-metalloendopeptidase family protein [Alphaproteobacteria bacterium]